MKRVFFLVLLLSNIIFAQSISISGRVLDSLNGEPLLNVNILIKRSNVGTLSTNDGSFQLSNVDKGNLEIQFSYVGYQTKLIHLKLFADTVITVELTQESIMFEESLVKGKQATVRETPVLRSQTLLHLRFSKI